MDTNTILQTHELHKTYPSSAGPVVAVEGLSLSVRAGQILGLLGPNGAGKTSTIRMLCGLIRPTSGQVIVQGQPITRHADEVRRWIGLVPEDAGDHANLTLAEELAFHGALYGLPRRQVEQRSAPLIDRLGLAGRVHDRLKTFSRGMRRKFHLIRALLHQPRILLLDEPTAGLDPQSAEEMWDLFKGLARQQQVTVVLCSHHLEEVERLCDHVAILRRRLVMAGSLADLRSQNSQYRIVLGEPIESARSLAEIPGVRTVDSQGQTLHVQLAGTPPQVMPEVVRRLVAGGARVVEVVRQDRDLRSLYRAAITESQEIAHD